MSDVMNDQAQQGQPIFYQSVPTEKPGNAGLFQKIFLPTLIYAILNALFLYSNTASIMAFPMMIATLIYVVHVAKSLCAKVKIRHVLTMCFLLLLSVSNAFTMSEYILLMNNFAMFFLLLYLLGDLFYQTEGWGLGTWMINTLGSIFTALGSLGDIGNDSARFHESGKKNSHPTLHALLVGLLVLIPLFAILTALLMSSDAVFSNLAKHLLPENLSLGNELLRVIYGLFVLWGFYTLIRHFGKRAPHLPKENPAMHSQITAGTILIPIGILYLVYSVIQILYLFIGGFTLPEDMTYAEYAHEGFYQLLLVVLLNLIIILVCAALFERTHLIRISLTVITLCTYIMIASATLRMVMYVDAYYLTVLRVLTLWALGTLALCFLGVLISIFHGRFPLFRYFVLVISILYIGLSFSKMEYHIASYNIAHGQTYELYLLSADAAPAIAKMENQEDSFIKRYVFENDEKSMDSSILHYNFSAAKFRKLYESHPAWGDYNYWNSF